MEEKLFKRLQGSGICTVGSPERIIAIVLDNEIISAPSVTEEIPNGQAVITGNFTLEEASQLAALIREARSGRFG